jgi:hypothetical protein
LQQNASEWLPVGCGHSHHSRGPQAVHPSEATQRYNRTRSAKPRRPWNGRGGFVPHGL